MKISWILIFCLVSLPAYSQKNAEEQFAEIDAKYQNLYENMAGNSFQASVDKLNKNYLGALRRKLKKATDEANLELAVAYRDEMKLVESGEAVLANAADTPAELKELRNTYQKAFQKFETTRDENAKPIYAAYDQDLATLQKKLTKASLLDDALKIKKKREQLSLGSTSAPPAPIPDIPTSGPEKTQMVVPPPKPTMKTNEAKQTILEWVINHEHIGFISRQGKVRKITKKEGVPSDHDYDLIAVVCNIGPNKRRTTTVPFPWKALPSVTTIKEFSIAPNELTPPNLHMLHSLTKLEKLGIRDSTISMELLAALPDSKKLEELQFYQCTGFDETCLPLLLKKYPGVKRLTFEIPGKPLSASTVKAMDEVWNLERLHFRGIMDEVALKQLGTIKSLESVFFRATNFTTPEALLALENVKIARFQKTSKDCFPHIAKLPNLEKLYIPHNNLTGELPWILSAKKISTLELGANSHLTGACFTNLARLKDLRELRLHDSAVSDDELEKLQSLKKLEAIWLHRTKITDKGIKHLEKMRHLRRLDIKHTQVTKAGVAQLRKALPSCKIFH